MTTTRRSFLQAMAAGSSALGAGWLQGGPLRADEKSALHAARRQAAHRQRRMIYNNDGDDIWAAGVDSKEKFWDIRHVPLLGTQIDSIYYCTTQSFNLFTHSTRVAEIFVNSNGQFKHNNLPLFLAQQTDGLRMSCEFAHAHGLESIWTLRMNDIHDSFEPLLTSQWKKEKPSRVMAQLAEVEQIKDRRRLWSLVDFENPEVQPRILAIIEEVLQNYPVDGVELDFMRAPFYFRSTYEGRAAEDHQVQLLSQLVEKIRQLVLTESERQGKPFLLAARVPSTIQHCNYIGIDIGHWLKAGWLDVLAISGGYVPFDQQIADLIALGHQHDVPVYPAISQSGLNRRPPRSEKEVPHPIAHWRGAAAQAWGAGADGIYAFNVFIGPGPNHAREFTTTLGKSIGSIETLEKFDRCFACSDANLWMGTAFWAKDVESYSTTLPLKLQPSVPGTIPIQVAGPVTGPGETPTTELRLEMERLPESDTPSATLNGQPLGAPVRREPEADIHRLVWTIPTSSRQSGSNTVQLTVASDQVRVVAAEIWFTAK